MSPDEGAAQTIDVVTPAAGESVSEGTILEWLIKVGDPIKADDTIVEISTDKVDVELPSPATGTVSEILVEEGETVTVGQVIARIKVGAGAAVRPAGSDGQENGHAGAPAGEQGGAADGARAPAGATVARASAPASAPAAAATAVASPGSAAGTLVDVVTPAAGESVTEGTILEWRAKLGERIKEGETIVEISTDKVDVELPSPATGTVAELLVEEGETVTVGQVIARVLLGAEDASTTPGHGNGQTSRTDGPANPDQADGQAGNGGGLPDGARISPVAARAAAAEGVDLTAVAGSGPAGRITKSDVLSAAGGNGAATNGGSGAALAEGSTAQPLRGGAAALARYMDESRSIPTATSFRTLTVTVLDARRRELKAAGRKVSFTHLIAYAIARAASDMPVMGNHFETIDGKPHSIDDGQVNL